MSVEGPSSSAEAWVDLLKVVGRWPLCQLFQAGVLNRRAVYEEARRACGGQEPAAYLERLAKFMGLRG